MLQHHRPVKLKPQRNGSTTKWGALHFSDSGHGSVTLGDCGGLLLEDAPDSDDSPALVRPFRMLSADLIRGYWVDYSDSKIWTPECVALFEGVTLYMDHNRPVAEWIGVATGARLTTSTGKLGVDADFHIDPTQDEILASGAIRRGMTLKPTPAIRACSVGIHFEAKPSHGLSADSWDFWRQLGEEKDGEIVRFIVSKILRIVECSLVYAGADPGAQSLAASIDAKAYLDLGALNTMENQFPLLLKAVKDVTGKDGEEAAPALYTLQDEVTTLRAGHAALEAECRDLLTREGQTNGRIQSSMLEPIKNSEGKELSPAWVNSLSIPALREFVRAPSQPSPKPAQNLQPPGKVPGSILSHTPSSAALAIAERFGKPVTQVMTEAAEYSNGLMIRENK